MKNFKLFVFVMFGIPAMMLLVGYNGSRPALAEAPPGDQKKVPRQLYFIQHYRLAEPQIVVTVNQFPFDVGGLRPYELNVQGQRYHFDPRDVKEFLSKGRPMNTYIKELPTGAVISDGITRPIELDGTRSTTSGPTVLHVPGEPRFVSGSGRTR
jgi:hypothetical protein